MKKIKSLPFSLRPRERLLKYGPQILTDEELICVILVTGTKNESVTKIAKRVSSVLKKNKEIDMLLFKSLHFGPSKTAQLLAVLELSRRMRATEVVKIKKPQEVYALSGEIINNDRESLLCFYLNARGELLKKEVVAVGSLNKANILPREIFSIVRELPVSSIILVHNHPSGDMEASETDLVFTKRIQLAGEILGIKLLDHLIVSSQGWKKIKF